MPTFKAVSLILKDVSFYLTGTADLAAQDMSLAPRLYPIDFSYQLKRKETYFSPLDGKGIPLCFVRGVGNCYLFSRIAAYGLVNWNEANKKPSQREYKQAFLSTAEWVRQQSHDGQFQHQFELAGMKKGWISCISQGELASLLVRAYWETGDSSFLDAAVRAVQFLCIPISEGGLYSRLPDGGGFFEEYPNTSINYVLNGCLYALVGLLDVVNAMSHSAKKQHFENFASEVVNTLERNIAGWDRDGWSTYDYGQRSEKFQNLNTMTYHTLQTAFLRHVAGTVKSKILRDCADRWAQNRQSLWRRSKAGIDKAGYRLTKGYV